MSLPEPIQGLDEIADRYDVVLSDVWGVIHNGRERFAPACRALFGGTPAELGIALHSSARLRSTYTRRPALEMTAARRAGDLDAARTAAAFALRAVEVGA